MSNKFSSSALLLSLSLSPLCLSHTFVISSFRILNENFHLFSFRNSLQNIFLIQYCISKETKGKKIAGNIIFIDFPLREQSISQHERNKLTSKLHLRERKRRSKEIQFFIEKSLINYLITSFSFQSSLAECRLFVHLCPLSPFLSLTDSYYIFTSRINDCCLFSILLSGRCNLERASI